MKFSAIKNLLEIWKKKYNIRELDVDIAISVKCASYGQLSDEEFDLLCDFVYAVWDDVDKGYTQLVADIVVDLYQDCGYGYRRDGRELTLEDLKECDWEKREMVSDIFYDAYYN